MVWGTADAVTPVAQGREIARLVPRSTLVELAGVGHIPAIEATERFNASLVQAPILVAPEELQDAEARRAGDSPEPARLRRALAAPPMTVEAVGR